MTISKLIDPNFSKYDDFYGYRPEKFIDRNHKLVSFVLDRLLGIHSAHVQGH